MGQLHLASCPNPKVDILEMDVSDVVDKFWDEFDAFSKNTGLFAKRGRWTVTDVIHDKSFAWHKKYSLHSIIVLGLVACRATSKHLGIGSAERVWGNTEYAKAGKLVSCNQR